MPQTPSVRFSLGSCKFLSGATLLVLLPSTGLLAQQASFPLEAVKASGTALTLKTVTDIAGLSVGTPINKDGMEAACKRLADSGLFASIGYQYAPGPKRGYIVTLNLTDQEPTTPAIVDLPGVEEGQVWSWLNSKYPNFVGKIPESAQDFLARDIETHFGPALQGNMLPLALRQTWPSAATRSSLSPKHFRKSARSNLLEHKSFIPTNWL